MCLPNGRVPEASLRARPMYEYLIRKDTIQRYDSVLKAPTEEFQTLIVLSWDAV